MNSLLALPLILATTLPTALFAAEVPDEPPHAQAIRLVVQARGDEIRMLDHASGWWHDTKERAWSAKRPFGPGVVDSTHYFHVSYAVDGKVLATWSVNTRTGQVGDPGEPMRIGQ